MLDPTQKLLSSTCLVNDERHINQMHNLKLIHVPMCGDDFGVKMSCSGARQRNYATYAQWLLIP